MLRIRVHFKQKLKKRDGNDKALRSHLTFSILDGIFALVLLHFSIRAL